MNHNDANSDEPRLDPDATEVVAMDLEAMLHLELDLQKASQSKQAARPKASVGSMMNAALPLRTSTPRLPAVSVPRPRSSSRVPAALRPSARFPLSRSAIPRMPIHTLPPPAPEEEDEDPTSFYDRRRASVPSVKSVSFRASEFNVPAAPIPFDMAAPVVKRDAGESMGITPIQPVLAPTSRRELLPRTTSAFESLAPMSMGASMYPHAAPHASKKLTAATLSLVLTLAFAVASVALMGMALLMPGVFHKPTAAKPAQKPVAAATAPTTIAVPPVLIEQGIIEVVPENQAYVIFPDSARGHRLFIDGRVVGEGNERGMLVECGKHKVQLGSNGTPRAVDLPCGGGWRLTE